MPNLRDLKRFFITDRYYRQKGDLFTAYGLELHVPKAVDFNIRYRLARGNPLKPPRIAGFRNGA